MPTFMYMYRCSILLRLESSLHLQCHQKTILNDFALFTVFYRICSVLYTVYNNL